MKNCNWDPPHRADIFPTHSRETRVIHVKPDDWETKVERMWWNGDSDKGRAELSQHYNVHPDSVTFVPGACPKFVIFR